MTLHNAFEELATETTAEQTRDGVVAVRERLDSRILVGNARSKFRDGFATAIPQPSATWRFINETPDTAPLGQPGSGLGHLVERGGDAAGSSYLRISLSPFDDDSSVWLTSEDLFRLPTRLGWGISASQRVLGQELLIGIAQAGGSDPAALGLERTDPVGEVAITGNITVTSNAAVVPLAPGHPFRSGDRVLLRGCADTRLNVAPVIVSSADATSITVTITIANATYTATGGYVRTADPVARAYNAVGMLVENGNATQATLVARRNGTKPRMRTNTISTTTANSAATGSFHDSLISAGVIETLATMDESSFRSWGADSVGATTAGSDRFTQAVADEELDYRLIIRARNLDELSKPIARITSITKNGTTTATVTTDVPHGLTTSSRVGIIGVRDLTNFPNATDLAVASVPTSTTFTVVLGAATTATSTDGGVVWINHGQVTSPGAAGFAVQSIDRVNGVLRVTLNTTASGFAVGETYQIHGLNAAGRGREGAYRVVRINGSVVEFDSPGADVASVTTGGALIRRTDYRIHFVRVLDHTRHLVEVIGGRGNTLDQNNAVPTIITNGVNLGSVTPGTGAAQLGKAEDNAHTSGDVGVMMLGVRQPATPATQTSAVGDYGAVALDAEGKLVVVQGADPALTFQSVTTLTSTTAGTARASAGTGLRTYVTDITATNTSATATRVDVIDATGTPTVMWSAWLPPGGTVTKELRTPLRGTAATPVTVQSSVAVTDVRVSLSGYSGV